MELFNSDFYRMTGRSPQLNLHNVLAYFTHHNLRYIRLLRRYQKHPNILLRLRLQCYTTKYELEISPKADIGEGFYLGHPYNITVAEGVRLGRNVNLHKGCTIGRENRGKRRGVPTIGNCVFVGINATVVGNISIGDDVMIAPNSIVNFDVPSHSIVIGNPGVIHPRENATQGYICHTV